MKPERVAWLLGAFGLLSVATVGYFSYRLYQQSQIPTLEELREQAYASRIVATDIAQANIAALLNVTLSDLDGKAQPFSQWRDKVRVINYWASWCPPCIAEMPMFSRVHERMGGKGVQFLGIGMDEPEKMRTFAKKVPIAYPLLIGASAANDNPGLTVRGLPYTVILDRTGKIVYSRYGGVKEEELAPMLENLVSGK